MSFVQRRNGNLDARNKIILNKRTKITDARDRLAELAKRKDARLKLEQLRTKKFKRDRPLQNRIPALALNTASLQNKKPRAFIDLTRQVRNAPLELHSRSFLQNRDLEQGFQTNSPSKAKTIYRTVENDDVEYLPPTRGVLRSKFDDEMVIGDIRPMSLSGRKASMNLKIITHNEEARARQQERRKSEGILKKRLRAASPPRHESERPRLRVEVSPPRPPSILKKRSMVADTIKPPSSRHDKRFETSNTATEYRIIVSNLRNSVTGADIRELFGDVGGLQESRLVRPGTAEVIYKTLEDAQRAVDLYHNRQLDGQPMNCLLVNPRSSVSLGRSSSTKTTGSNCSVAPDIAAFHKVLFSQY